MKKIFCFISLLMAFNVHAQLPMEILKGKSSHNICYIFSEPGDALKIKFAECTSGGDNLRISVGPTTQNAIKYFISISPGIWNLNATFVDGNNSTVFVFIKK